METSFFWGWAKLVSSRGLGFSVDESFSDEKNRNLKADEAEAEDEMGVGEVLGLEEEGERRVRAQRETFLSKVLLMASSRVLDLGFTQQFLLGHLCPVCVPYSPSPFFSLLASCRKNLMTRVAKM